ncbi:MAG TPA: SDR family NAD(P)-dependent oxidoreductase [Bryobacteraceae bacterium]|nr:SDR family NAD(P)-dependent oxidoreductase [Bryobacteraceae bacterium]
MRLQDKVVLITGGSEGIGASCATAFRRRGARLSLTARSREKLEEVGGSGAVITVGDLGDPETRRAAVESTIEHFGRIDILLNNAGAGLYAPSWQARMEDVRRMFELNFFAALSMIQLVVPHMQRQRSGCIVNLGSIAGKVTLPWFTLYSASKFAIGSLTDGLRMELKRDGIHAMTVCPGYVQTGFQEHVLAGNAPAAIAGRKQFAITAEQCAEAIARGVERNARTVVTPRAGWVFVALEHLFPRLVDSQLERIYRQQDLSR